MRYLVPISILFFLGLAIFMGKGLWHAVFPGKPIPYKPPVQEQLHKEEPKPSSGDGLEIVQVKSGPIAPGVLVEDSGAVYQVGQMSPHGYVEKIQDNVAKCVEGKVVRFVVFSRGRIEVKSAQFMGSCSSGVCTTAGTFRPGEETEWGLVVKADFFGVEINRPDGGKLYVMPDLEFPGDNKQDSQSDSGIAMTDGGKKDGKSVITVDASH